MDRTFTSMSFDSFYWIPTYGLWLREFDQAPAYQDLKQWLQVLQWQSPERHGQPWMLKSPHHLTAVDTVLDTFPDCKIMMTHRSPTKAVPSYASMVCAISAQYSDDVDPMRRRTLLARPVRLGAHAVLRRTRQAPRAVHRRRLPGRREEPGRRPRHGSWASSDSRPTEKRSRPTWPATRSNGTAPTPTQPRTSGSPKPGWSKTLRSIRRRLHRDPQRRGRHRFGSGSRTRRQAGHPCRQGGRQGRDVGALS